MKKRYVEKRPWGNFQRFTLNEKTTVKIITVKPNQELSLQFHKNRNEFWKILEGKARVTIGNIIMKGLKGSEFSIAPKTRHRIRALKEKVKFLEISFGKFSEEDIVRLEDRYGRIKMTR